jgi:hypothetical protein
LKERIINSIFSRREHKARTEDRSAALVSSPLSHLRSRIIEPVESKEPMVMKKTTFQPCERLVDGKLASYLRPRLLLAIILLVITMSTVAEADCWEDSLNQVNRDILRMASGAVYQVVPSDAINSAFWLPLTNANICDSVVDVGGELMTYYQIFNMDTGAWVWAERER